MQYDYHIADVFTGVAFGGNPLAVLPRAEGLGAEQMLAITREFNYSETTFVLPPEQPGNDARVRIFTPAAEIPFAGHPNIGTAHVLGALAGGADGERTLRFEELAGVVPVRVRMRGGVPEYGELTAPQPLELGPALDGEGDAGAVARALSLDADDLVTTVHHPRRASVGLPFVCVEVRDLRALARSAMRADLWPPLAERAGCNSVHLYTRATGDDAVDLRCRMYTANHGPREDPATGSANCALAGMLAALAGPAAGTVEFAIAQGVEMGRPSALHAAVEKRGGAVTEVRIGGASVSVAAGKIRAG